MMFSATLSSEMRTVCKKFMQDPMEIYVDDSKLTLHGLQQHYVKLAENEKNRKLNELLDALEFNQVVIFVKSGPSASSSTNPSRTSSTASSCPPTSGAAASISSASTSSSTTTCPRCQTPTCIASAALAVSAPRASPSPSSPTMRMPRRLRTCSRASRCPSRSCPRLSTP